MEQESTIDEIRKTKSSKKQKGKLPTPEQQREAQRLKDAATRAWAVDRKVGTEAPTFPERR